MSNQTLYKITSEFLELEDLFLNGEFTDEEYDEMSEKFNQIEMNFKDKADNIAYLIKRNQDEAKNIKTREEELKSLRQTKEKRVEKLKNLLLNAMLVTNNEKFETSEFKFSTRKSKEVIISDLEKLPNAFKKEKTTIEPDKTLIKTAIQSGSKIEGAHLQENVNLQVK